MAYRSEEEASLARAAALADQVAALEAENAALKAVNRAKATPPKGEPAAEVGKVYLGTTSVVSALAPMAVSLVAIVVGIFLPSTRRELPVMPWTAIGISCILVGAAWLGSNGYHALYPRSVILQKQESGESLVIDRSPARRRVYFAISLGLYLAGLAIVMCAPLRR